MEAKFNKENYLIAVKKRARRTMIFYAHLVCYFIVVALLLYNLYNVEGVYKNNIISLNLSVLFAWTVFIIIHGLNIFRGKRFFNKSWEDRKVEGFLKQEDVQTTFWE